MPAHPADALSLEAFYEHAPCGYLSLLVDGTVVRVNQTLLEWTGRERPGLLGGRFAELLTVGGQIFFETHCMPVLLAGQRVEQMALDLRRVDGTALPVLLAADLHARDASGAPELIRATLVDISHRRRFERQLVALNDELARSNEEYDTFAYAASHDLKAPLRGVLQNADFFLEDFESQVPAEGVEQIRTVVRLADHMTDMLDDLLAYAQAGRGVLQPETIDLSIAVAEVTELLGPRAAGAAITAHAASFTVDPGALRQVLLNLVLNAVKYSGDAPHVTVGTCTLDEARAQSSVPATVGGEPGATPVLFVADRGIGFAPELHERVFELFRQLDPATEGSGAGLALSRRVCRRHGGDLWVSSTPGEGSTFYMLVDAQPDGLGVLER